MTDKDLDLTGEPGDELDTDETLEDGVDAEGDDESEFEEEEAEEAAAGAAGGRRFGFGRGRKSEELHEKHLGGVQASHERVHIDDRASALFALICAGGLVGVLAFAWVGGVLPKPAAPSLAPLVVPTAKATASPSASPSIVVTPSPTAAPTASPSLSPAPSASK